MKRSTSIFRLALTALVTFLVATPAMGQGGAVLMDPASVLLTGQPNQLVNGQVRLSNPVAEPTTVRLYLSDWAFNSVGDFEFFDVGSEERSASSWVAFNETVITLGPNESRLLEYTVNIPADANEGTHWTVLFAEGEPEETTPGQTGAMISIRVGHIIYMNLPDLYSDGAVLGVFGVPPTEAGEPYVIVAQYANTGNAAQNVQGTFSLRSETGNTVMSADIDRTVVLPESDRAFVINVHGPLAEGFYTAIVVLNFGDVERDVAGSFDFFLEVPLSGDGEG